MTYDPHIKSQHLDASLKKYTHIWIVQFHDFYRLVALRLPQSMAIKLVPRHRNDARLWNNPSPAIWGKVILQCTELFNQQSQHVTTI